MTHLAVSLAKQARDQCADQPVWIAGSVVPLEDCYEPDLTPNWETEVQEYARTRSACPIELRYSCKVLLSTRPYFTNRIYQLLMQKGFDIEEILELPQLLDP